MCSHQRGEIAMNILKINKDVSPMWKKKKKKNIGAMSQVGPWAKAT